MGAWNHYLQGAEDIQENIFTGCQTTAQFQRCDIMLCWLVYCFVSFLNKTY